MTDTTVHGPIDFVLIEFPDGAVTSAVSESMTALLESGTLALYDIAEIRCDADGNSTRVDLNDAASSGLFAQFAGAESGLFDESDIEMASEILEAGTSALLIAYENSWARQFVSAAHDAGGRMIATERISAQALLDALEALEAAGA